MMADPDRRILMGRIGAAHGVKGEVRIVPFTDEPMGLVGYRTFETNRPGLAITIAAARPARNLLVARLEGVGSREAAERLNGVELYVERSRLPPAEDEDDFYVADLIGLTARLADGTEIGKVRTVINHGAGDILEVSASGGDTLLFPFARHVVPEVHVAAGYLVIEPPLDAEPGDEEPA